MSQQALFTEKEPRIGESEELLSSRGIQTIIGVDEAGRGPLAGPVHAGAFWLDLGSPLPTTLVKLDDSKKLDEDLREELFAGLHEEDRPMAIGVCDARVVEEINILQATFRAMGDAVEQVIAAQGELPDLVLIDGNMIIPGRDWKQQSVVKGDGRSLAIAAASILAKVSRDRIMRQAHERWPHYGFDTNKGYGTIAHREALRVHGHCELHRRTFAGVLPEKE